MRFCRPVEWTAIALVALASGTSIAQPGSGGWAKGKASDAPGGGPWAKSGTPGWRGAAWPRLIPVRRIGSDDQVITGSGDPADVYYPEPLPGKRSAHIDRYPLVVFLQGALVDKEYYTQYALELARYGFVVVVPNHISSILGGSGYFAEMKVITDVLEHMRLEDASPDSPVYQIVDTSRMGLGGHSFGGATALFAIAGICTFPFCRPSEGYQIPPEVKAAALSGTNSQSFTVDTTGTPVALISGDEERSIDDAMRTYQTLALPRAFVTVHGTNHFGLNDISEPPGAQTDRGEPEQIIPQSLTATRFARWAGLFLRAHMLHDPIAWRIVYRSGGDENVTVVGEP